MSLFMKESGSDYNVRELTEVEQSELRATILAVTRKG